MQSSNERAGRRSPGVSDAGLTVARLSAAADDLTELAAGLGGDAAWAARVAEQSIWMTECDGRAYRAARMAGRLAGEADRLRSLADAIFAAYDGPEVCALCGGEAGRCASRGGLL